MSLTAAQARAKVCGLTAQQVEEDHFRHRLATFTRPGCAWCETCGMGQAVHRGGIDPWDAPLAGSKGQAFTR